MRRTVREDRHGSLSGRTVTGACRCGGPSVRIPRHQEPGGLGEPATGRQCHDPAAPRFLACAQTRRGLEGHERRMRAIGLPAAGVPTAGVPAARLPAARVPAAGAKQAPSLGDETIGRFGDAAQRLDLGAAAGTGSLILNAAPAGGTAKIQIPGGTHASTSR